jgi:hypothetical protein
MLDDIIAARERLRAAAGIADTIGASWAAFELVRSASRSCASRDDGLFAAYTMAATIAVEGRNTLASAPSLTEAAQPVTCTVPPGTDVVSLAADLASLAEEISACLTAAADHARTAGDAGACRDAAREADALRDLLGG